MTNQMLSQFEYLNRFYTPDFLSSINKENHLYKFLLGENPKLVELRSDINKFLELAYRYNLVGADLESRLKSEDYEFWQASMNELGVANAIERCFGIGCLRWHPQGQKRKVGEYEIFVAETGTTIFVEVKTVFPREMERLESQIIDKLYRYSEQIHIPSMLSVTIESLGTSESFSGKNFKDFLSKELIKISSDADITKDIELNDYHDNRTGLHLKITVLTTTPNEIKNCHIGIIGGEARWVQNEE
jgi:hypothetical protein